MILSAIDIGSNAARLLVAEVTDEKNGKPVFTKLNFLRIPLRFGFDVFDTGRISEEKKQLCVTTMQAFKLVMEIYKSEAYLACATSAMRDAQNSADIIEAVKNATGLNIEIISGDKEANLIYENHIAENMDKSHSYMYIDVGGGSTEISFFSNGILVYKRSFNIGTIRLLKDMVSDAEWDGLKSTVKAVTKGHKSVRAIGSGGNINKIFSLSKQKEGKSLLADDLKAYLKTFSELSVAERMEKFNLRADRADVVVPALRIFTNVMRWSGANEIFVPKIGLADGLVRHLWEERAKKLI